MSDRNKTYKRYPTQWITLKFVLDDKIYDIECISLLNNKRVILHFYSLVLKKWDATYGITMNF